jgi:hypothetical protein
MAGWLAVNRLAFDPLPLLGIYPSVEAITGQVFALVLVAFSFWAARRGAVAQAA